MIESWFMREEIKDRSRVVHVNWRMIANMRNFLVHEYFRVDSEVVWEVIHTEIVELKVHIMDYLNEE